MYLTKKSWIKIVLHPLFVVRVELNNAVYHKLASCGFFT